MRTLEEQITQYAAYHRDRRNIATHFIGIPLIVFSVTMGLSLVHLPALIGGLSVALVLTIVAVAYYFKLDYTLGIADAGVHGGQPVARHHRGYDVSCGHRRVDRAGHFVAGWIIQFVGHKFEGMKPAFFDDIMGLAIGPLFVMTEAFFLLKLKPELQRYVEARVGPTLAARNGATIGPAQ